MTDRYESRATTHAADCWSWGPAHYECAVREIERLRGALAHPTTTHCDNCGCDWLDNGLNPIGCPYCKQSEYEYTITALRERLGEGE